MKVVIFSLSPESLVPLAEKLGGTTFDFRNPKVFRKGMSLDYDFDIALFDAFYPDLFADLKEKGKRISLNGNDFVSIEHILEEAKPIRRRKKK